MELTCSRVALSAQEPKYHQEHSRQQATLAYARLCDRA